MSKTSPAKPGRPLFLLLLTMWLGLAVSACASSAAGNSASGPIEIATAQKTAFSIPDSTSPVTPADLRVSPLDVLEIRVFGVPDLNGEYQIDQDGRIKFPLIGSVNVKGYSVFELATLLEEKLGVSHLQNPDVTVKVKEAFARQITVEGAVKGPGVFPVRGELTLLQAIALAQGETETANTKRVVIFRTIEGKKAGASFDLQQIRKGKIEDPQIYGNDLIVVDGSEVKESYREFLRSIPLLSFFLIL